VENRTLVYYHHSFSGKPFRIPPHFYFSTCFGDNLWFKWQSGLLYSQTPSLLKKLKEIVYNRKPHLSLRTIQVTESIRQCLVYAPS